MTAFPKPPFPRKLASTTALTSATLIMWRPFNLPGSASNLKLAGNIIYASVLSLTLKSRDYGSYIIIIIFQMIKLRL